MDILFFLVKYIPFWAFPVLCISVLFSYIYWLKDILLIAYVFAFTSFICFTSLLFWVWAGGPDNSVQLVIHIMKTF